MWSVTSANTFCISFLTGEKHKLLELINIGEVLYFVERLSNIATKGRVLHYVVGVPTVYCPPLTLPWPLPSSCTLSLVAGFFQERQSLLAVVPRELLLPAT